MEKKLALTRSKSEFFIEITQDSYNHGGHRPPSFDWKLKIVHGSLLHKKFENEIEKWQ
jgi:hypothetical protein